MALLHPHRFFKQSSGRIFLATSAVADNAKVGTKNQHEKNSPELNIEDGTLTMEL
jgi:hypothetical protein